MRFDNEFAAVEEGAVEVENSELHWNDSDGWITEQTPRVYSSFERLLPLIRLSTNVGIGSNCEELSVSKCLPAGGSARRSSREAEPKSPHGIASRSAKPLLSNHIARWVF